MKHLFNIFILIMLTFFFVACNSKQKKELSLYIPDDMYVVDVDRLKEETTINYSSFFDKMKIIPLETVDESLIGRIDNIKVTDNYLFILDRSIARKLLVFDKNGKFLQQIGQSGRGPTEYEGISDFTINEKAKEVLVLDVKPRICIYDMETGEFIRSILLENRNSRSSRIQYFEDKIYLNLVNYEKNADSYMLKELDYFTGKQTGKFVNEAFNNKAFKSKFMLEDPYFINKAQDKPVFYRQFMDTVFTIGKDGVSPYVVLTGKNIITEEIVQQYNLSSPEDILQFIHTDIIHQIINFEEYKDFIFIKYLKGFFIQSLVIDKHHQQIKEVKNSINNFMHKPDKEGPVPTISCIAADGAYGVVDPSDFKYYLQLIGKSALTPEVENFFRNLSEESNPVIIYYEFKK